MAAEEGRKVYVQNVPARATVRDLFRHMCAVGDVELCYIAQKDGKQMPYAFLSYTTVAAAQRAVNELSDTKLLGTRLDIEIFKNTGAEWPYPPLPVLPDNASRHRVFLRGLNGSISETALQRVMGRFGDIKNAYIVRKGAGKVCCVCTYVHK